MNFDEAPEAAAFRMEVRGFLEAHATRKTGTDVDWSNGPLDDSDESDLRFLHQCQEWQRTLYDNGWAGLSWPTAFGGRGATSAELVIYAEEAGAFDVTNGFFGVAQSLVGPALMHHGSAAQQARYLPPLLRGDEMWCQLFSEPGAGSDLAALATRAVLDGDEYVATGQKVWSSEAHHADLGILIARTDPDKPKHRGITFFVLDMHQPGVEVRPLRQATGQRHFNEVFLDAARIPVDSVVGEVDGGWAVTRTVLTSEAGMIGGGAGGPGNFAGMLRLARALGCDGDAVVRQGLADVYASEQMLRYMGMRIQTVITTGRGTMPDPSVLKNFLTGANERKADLALSLQGARGLLAGEDAEDNGLWQYNSLVQFSSRIGGGTNEVHRNMIAERALGLPRDVAPDKDRPWRERIVS